MSEAQNKTIARRFKDEVWDKGDEAALDELFAEDAVDHGAILGQPPGREGHKYQLALFRSAFPDLYVTAEDIFSEGDEVAYRWTGRGTHQGELMGMAPSGIRMTITGTAIARISGSKVEEGWQNFDALGMMQQLGVNPPRNNRRKKPALRRPIYLTEHFRSAGVHTDSLCRGSGTSVCSARFGKNHSFR